MPVSNLSVLKSAVAEWHASKGCNFDAWLDCAHEEIVIRSLGAGAPGLAAETTRTGKAAFQSYLEGHNRTIDLRSFEISDYICEGDRVAGFGTVSLAGRATGKTCTTDVALYAKFMDGKIIELAEFFDTKRLADAFAA